MVSGVPLQGQYPIPPLRYDVPTPPVTVQGQFNITLQLFERDKQIGCLNVHLCIGYVAGKHVLGLFWVNMYQVRFG